jgi:sterol 3beta-glucosyltransferase
MDFSETIEVKVEDKDNSLPVDSYFFAYFRDFPDALEQIRDAVRNYRSQNRFSTQSTPPLLDTTALRSPISVSASSNYPKGTSFRFSSLFRPFSDTSLLTRGSATTAVDSNCDDYTHVQRKDNSSFIPITLSPKTPTSLSLFRQGTDSTSSTTHSLPIPDHTYPPSTSNSTIYPDASSLNRDSTSYWGLGVPAWIKSPRRAFGGTLDSQVTLNGTHVKEVYSSAVSSPGPMATSRSPGTTDLAFSILETPDSMVDHETTEKFRSAFAYDEKETLLGCRFLNDSHERCSSLLL